MADPAATTLALEAQDLVFSYGATKVVDLPSFALPAGESVAIIGPSGCGKTTLLHLFAGLLPPAAGSIRILGTEVTSLAASEWDRFRGHNIGMVFQRLLLIPALSVRQNLELARKLSRTNAGPQRIDELLQQLGVAEQAEHKPSMLSQGQAQRVAIARALVHSPALVLADEPTSALDDDRAGQALQLLKGAAQSAGAALVVVTHDQRVRGALDHELELHPVGASAL